MAKSKTKYRIILESEYYYPQYKGWICWNYIYRCGLARYCFSNLKDAEKFIETWKDYKPQNSFTTVVKEYDGIID